MLSKEEVTTRKWNVIEEETHGENKINEEKIEEEESIKETCRIENIEAIGERKSSKKSSKKIKRRENEELRRNGNKSKKKKRNPEEIEMKPPINHHKKKKNKAATLSRSYIRKKLHRKSKISALSKMKK